MLVSAVVFLVKIYVQCGLVDAVLLLYRFFIRFHKIEPVKDAIGQDEARKELKLCRCVVFHTSKVRTFDTQTYLQVYVYVTLCHGSLQVSPKNTRKFDNPFTAQFRDVLSKAHDPAKTFFEDLPEALGYHNLNNDEFVGQYLGLIRTAVRDLNTCYDLLIGRIESQVVEHLGLPQEFETYKEILDNRYSTINSAVLTPKSKSFLERVLSVSESRREFFEKICIVITDKRLDDTKDNEEELLVKNLLYLFSELERASAISNEANMTEGDEAFNFELATSNGSFSHSQTYRLSFRKKERAEKILSDLSERLSGDDELDICVLLKLLNTKIK